MTKNYKINPWLEVRFYIVLMLICGLIPFIYLYISRPQEYFNTKDLTILMLTIVVDLIFVLIFMNNVKSEYLVDENRIIIVNLFKKKKEVNWEDIKSLKILFGPTSGSFYVVYFGENKRFQIFDSIVGFQELKSLIEHKSGKKFKRSFN